MEVESLAGRRSMSLAVEELDRMGRIVEDLLLLARLDDGMLLAKDTVEVELVVGEALLQAILGPGDLTVRIPQGLTVQGDADRLLQVLVKLVTNAALHGGGAPIAVSAQQVMGDSVEIDVADRGPGISAEDLPHVFERLYRGSKARSWAPGGAGLGLAVAASLVQAMDGTIRAESKVGLGTTFTVKLPEGNDNFQWVPNKRRSDLPKSTSA
jgi:signal transduction histidine kinase